MQQNKKARMVPEPFLIQRGHPVRHCWSASAESFPLTTTAWRG